MTAATAPAEAILAAFDAYLGAFCEVTGRATGRFLRREWHAAQDDATERLTVYPREVERVVGELRGRVPAPPADSPEEAAFKTRYAALARGRPDAEMAATFFNSVVRRVLGTVGVDRRSEFTADCEPWPAPDAPPLHREYPAEGVAPELFERIFCETELAHAFADLPGDAALCARAAREQLGAEADAGRAAEVLPFPFFRNKGAYLVARLRLASGAVRPLVVPLGHPPEGVRPDAVLTAPDEIHVVFSFARSYFHADTGRVRETVEFLRSLMPAKPVNELYNSLGHNRHGKTELYRELTRQLAEPDARFEPAEGVRGLVMTVFTLPAYNVVFKVIRDRFAAPKSVTRDRVMNRYRLVFAHDRVGRLADAQEFEHLDFPRERFAPELLAELLSEAGESVRVVDGRVVIRHLYTERRLRPLDLYLREAGPEAARGAVVEYGNAIKDLACANIFPGDLLLKNFGVSRHGRVIFYDYDELALLSEVRFRPLPVARNEEDEMSADPWFSVDEGDVFPEEFLPFLVPTGPLRDAFLEAHADLLTVAFWREMQRRQAAGEIPDFFPYPRCRRLRAAAGKDPVTA
ncbi:MAG TPA: bifunctional isocitrate dehydrogenase kinase/phosphatase [Longimicrobiaceae bacterium]|nr:bifunctional isocitrate dehydrogenase kinase/phosphatase [Longimicrobiaceae bacterium]